MLRVSRYIIQSPAISWVARKLKYYARIISPVYPGQPNNSGGTQICVEMIDVLAYLWNDYDCENPAAYACQHTSSAGPH